MTRRRSFLPVAVRLTPPAALALLAGLYAGHAAAVPASAQPAPVPAGAWTTVLGGFARLEDVVARGPDDLWAVGDGIVHWNGQEWRQVLTGPRPHLRAISALPDGTMWSVGALRAGSCDVAPAVLRYDGTAWHPEEVESHQPLWDVHMVAADDGWAVGGLERPVILRYDGARWRPFAEPEIGPLRAVHLVAPDDGWAVGMDGALARWDGRDWRAVAPPRGGIDLYDVVLVDQGFGWAVGAGIDPRAGVILALRDGTWRIEQLDRSPLLAAISAPARDVALAVGRFGTLLRWDGTAWRDIGRTYPGGFVPTGGAAPVPGAQAADGATSQDGAPLDGERQPAAAAIPDVPARRNDHEGPGQRFWRERVFAEGVYLRGLAVLTDSETTIAVGDAGQVVVVDGAHYQEVHAGRSLRAIDVLPDGTEGWILGRDGPPLRWNGQAWRPEPGPIELTWLRAIDAVAPGVAWAVGDAGTVMRFADGRWSRVPFPTEDNLGWLSFGAADDGWTSVTTSTGNGRESRIYRWDGSAWREAIHLCAVYVGMGAADGRGGAWFTASGSSGSGSDLLRFDGQGWWWTPILGAVAATDPVIPHNALALTPDGGGWAARAGVSRFDGASWRSLIDPHTANDWQTPIRVLYLNAIAASSQSAFWAIARDIRWSDDDVEGGTGGSWVTWFAPGTGYDARQPDDALGRAHLSTTRLNDLAVARLADGSTEVWAVGEGATILRYRQPAPANVPAASATRAPIPAGRWPTPTPHAVLVQSAAEAKVRTLFPVVEDAAPLVFERFELTDRVGAQARMDRAYGDEDWFDGMGISLGDGLSSFFASCPPNWSPWWWIEARGSTELGCSRIFGALDATNGENAEFYCTSRASAVYLPFAQTRPSRPSEPTPSPPPTGTPRSLTPVAVLNVEGPCPTPTPYPTGGWPYP